MTSPAFNRVTRWLSSCIGMAFMGTGLFAAVWSGSDPISLIQRVFWSGFIGIIVGMVAGQVCTALLKERLAKENQMEQSAEPLMDVIPEIPPTPKRLEPWNPPHVEIKDSTEG